jgi:hypothetical protein
MLKTATINLQPRYLSEQMLAASRQVWLASLGAVVVTREWAQKEAGETMKTLVREGTVVESRAIRFVGDQIEAQVTRANTLWKTTRRTVESTVKHAAETTVTLAQQVLPHSPLLPAIKIPGFGKPVKKVAKRAKKAPVARKPRVAKRAKRAAKTVTKA